MRVAVLGATGRTGRLVVDQVLAQGDEVIALARHPERIGRAHQNLTAAAADALDADSLRRGVAGADAVVSALGIGTSREETTVYSQGVGNLIEAMSEGAGRRISVISAAPAGPRTGQPFLERRIVMPILDRLFAPTYEDMRLMEGLLAASELRWVSVRPPRLLDKAGTGAYRMSPAPLPHARSIRCADLALALVDSLGRDDLVGRSVFVAN